MITREMAAQQLDTSYQRLKSALEGITEEEARRVLAGRLAPIVWQVGHLAVVDANYVNRGGGSYTVQPHYPDLFKPGTGGEADYPPLAEVWAAFTGAHQGLLKVAEQGDYSTPVEHPVRAYTNAGGMLVYACFHRGYHVGKTATLRALLGKPLPGPRR